ncbi:2-keto-4-pentenoate hydratase [Aldersonia kunmingensis]|uniref:2-keto-4-pentenoate hydratase n=1 Tax=Aldersonia kunmingensis TaxID=408066 RepID=UPI00082AEDF0|nr:2-keto-4-pentenoate hydratase [Aldersonia kunmingensis]
MLDAPARDAAATLLWEAERTSSPIEPLCNSFRDIDVVDAYEIQLRNIERKLANGLTICGHKVGLSSAVMQQMMGVNEPDYGHLLSDMAIEDGATVDLSAFCYPRIEVEVGFVLGDTLPGAGCTEADVLASTAHLVASIELIDSRIRNWQIAIADTIADNASSAGFVLGERHSLDGIDPADIEAVLYTGSEGAETEVTRGNSGAVLGNPVTAVAWLANKVAAFGVRLEAGHVILPGSCTKAIDVAAGDRFRAEFAGLGSVSLNFSRAQ